MQFVNIVKSILPIILLMTAGNVMNRIGFVSQKVVDGLKKLVTDVTLPCLLFMAFFNMKFDLQYGIICIVIFFVCFFAFGIGMALKKGFKVKNKYYATIFASFETGNIGYAIFSAVFGNDNLYMIAISDLGHIIFTVVFFFIYIKQLNGQKKQSAKEIAISIITMPIAVMTVLGLAVSILGVNEVISANFIGGPVVNVVERLSLVTVPVICLATGYELKIDWKNIKSPIALSLIRLSMNICLAFLINRYIVSGILHLDKVFQMAVYTMFILPPTFCVPAFIDDGGSGEKQLVLNTITIHLFVTLATYITIAVLMGF